MRTWYLDAKKKKEHEDEMRRKKRASDLGAAEEQLEEARAAEGICDAAITKIGDRYAAEGDVCPSS